MFVNFYFHNRDVFFVPTFFVENQNIFSLSKKIKKIKFILLEGWVSERIKKLKNIQLGDCNIKVFDMIFKEVSGKLN